LLRRLIIFALCRCCALFRHFTLRHAAAAAAYITPDAAFHYCRRLFTPLAAFADDDFAMISAPRYVALLP